MLINLSIWYHFLGKLLDYSKVWLRLEDVIEFLAIFQNFTFRNIFTNMQKKELV